MHFSTRLKSSPHCLPSPDGRLIAALFSSVVNIRAVETFEVVNAIKLPGEPSGPVLGFQWSPSSRRILVAFSDLVCVFDVQRGDQHFQATIRNATPPGSKPAYVGFGATDSDVCICSSLGIKFAVFDISSPTTKAVEISNPKLYSSATACRGFSFRPQTRHLALLTRTAGRDMISVHHPATREVQRSWAPDTLDAQGLVWSPDGRWLVVWESPAHGHKVLFYTPDGNLFRAWAGPRVAAASSENSDDAALRAGVKQVHFSADAHRLAIGDSSRIVTIHSMESVSESMRLQHPTTILCRDTLQVWQEQVSTTLAGLAVRTFIKATQSISPPGRPSASDRAEGKSGCALMSFDCSSALLATKLEDAPSTVWVWDVQASELRAVLMFHSSVSSLSWHPTIRETMLVRCDGDEYSSVAFIWDPLSEGPRALEFAQRFPEHKIAVKSQASWLNIESQSPAIFFSDGSEYILAWLGEPEQGSPPWHMPLSRGQGSAESRPESPLELIPADEGNLPECRAGDEECDSELEDTFYYKRGDTEDP